MNGIIYMRVGPNNHRYIGQTVKPEEVRWKEHVHESTLDSRKNTPLSAAIRKYGADSFYPVILECGIESHELLNEREEYWIKEYHSLTKEKQGGLNLTIGGLGHRLFTNDDFQDLYDAGYSIGEISQMTGAAATTVTDHTNTNRIENHRRGRVAALKKDPPRPVSCYDINTCELVYSYKSILEASLFMKPECANNSVVCNALRDTIRSAYGYLWKYDDEPMSVIYRRQQAYFEGKVKSKKGKPVINIDTRETFPSANSAGKKYGIDSRMIQDCCNARRKDAGGYIWRYIGREDIVFAPLKDNRKKAVRCIETNEIFETTKEAAIKSCIYINTLRDCLKKRIESAGGFHWEYYSVQE